MTVVTHFGDHFTVIGHASLQRNPYETLRYWAFYVGISLAGLLSLGAALSTIATVREAHGLMAAFLCCGKKSPFGLLASTGPIMCQGQKAMREDCLQSIRNFLWTHYRIASTLTCTSLALTVYAMMLCAFLWFAIHSYCGLDRRGRYSLTPRSHGCQPQEPSLF
ncbi:rCG48629, isoform CRA_g [Rattus norvegicus]|uniref:RCG48629, isoform CRA_g n=1 Tax=Rattus norvegicus TaxID=10116 RepID=A6HY95_RAT|nr:rCG48629, isoform CRA_g [Rattus norvegicus]